MKRKMKFIDGFLKAYSDMQGMDYNELMKQFMAK